MGVSKANGSAEPLSPSQIRVALGAILDSKSFTRSDRCSQFLRYIVEQSLSGNADDLKEYSLGLEVFGRPSSFDPRTDTIVRVQARRLRKKLEEYYYNEGSADPVVIDLAKGAYVPTFRSRNRVPLDERQNFLTSIIERTSLRMWIGLGGFSVAFTTVLLAWSGLLFDVLASSWWEGRKGQPKATTESAPLSVPLTALGGHEREPDLSPDGDSVAFVWDGQRADNDDIYVKRIGGDLVERLTYDPAPECCPSWSPDGRRIAFLRPEGAGANLFLVPVERGREERLAQLSHLGHQISWSPDGKYLAVEDRPAEEPKGIFLVSAKDGSRRRATAAPDGLSDRWPAFSPDGRTLAFARGNSSFTVYSVEIGGAMSTPQRITAEYYLLGGLDWTPDGGYVVFGVYSEEVGWRLWKAAAESRNATPTPSGILGWQPSFSRPPLGSRVRLAYAAKADDKNIYRIPGPGYPKNSGAASAVPERIAGSSRNDTAPQLSPAADKVAFVSGRTGHGEVWTSDGDGSNPLQVTFSGRSEVGSPSWSPDGRLIGFGGMTDANFDVFVVAAGGGTPRRLTRAPSNEGAQSWSRDGRWIYFLSDRTGRTEIFKMPSAGGEWVQVTDEGGHQAMESLDGKWLYYSKSAKRPGVPESLPGEGEPGIFRRPAGGGSEERVLEEGVFGRWALSKSGIYVLRSAAGDRAPSIEFYSYETWERETVITFPKDARFGIANSLTVSEDDRWIVYAKYDHTASNLMLVDDF